ncbi:flagellar protein FlgJ [Dysgonomonas alginatilytica]|uniref:Flagellar protein FlgJ n=1 Tax=Dysgonomonas alginatilytica TaxID=1605892 RepID=A0A2V3PR72_9BACT|nr:glucosaminidase domain-containing protein [Dysgonomonas alginatilytica]PXV66894.1 flagellar protein FlgJ [Dysgonomonas alginatilytica]
MQKLTPKEFIKAYLPYAKDSELKTGVDAIFTLAQAALESGWGERAVGNMFFGVKAKKDTPENKRQLLTTREVLDRPDIQFPEIISVTKRADGKYEYRIKDWFRKYNSPEQSFTDHGLFFHENKRYAKALEVRYNPYLFAEAITKAGYATDPNYATILKGVITTIYNNM